MTDPKSEDSIGDVSEETLSNGHKTEKDLKVRKCIVTGALKPKEDLIRFVIGPDGSVFPDIEGKLPGRGLWLSAEKGVVNTACQKNTFAKAARRSVNTPDNLVGLIEDLLAKRCLNLLGMARRAGVVVAGFEKVQARLRSGKAGALLAASDGAAGGREKIKALAPGTPLLDMFSSSELAQALGRENVVHAVVSRGGLAKRLCQESARINGFRHPERSIVPAQMKTPTPDTKE